MDGIVRGIHQFRETIFFDQREFFRELATKPQMPRALLITCSDSRINPNLITQTEPGELFLLRNAGNIIPPYGTAIGGEGATIEYAIAVLNIANIIVCGHTNCGAIKTLLSNNQVQELPAVASWFAHAEATRRIAQVKYAHLSGKELEIAVVEENVLIQLNNLSTHPYVAARMSTGDVRLFGWCYDIENGEVLEYDQTVGQFHPIGAEAHAAVPLPLRRHI